jgi:microcystin-dependent protein
MSDPFVAEIRMFGFNFAPTGWAQCNGQLLPISQNTALFSLLGTFYGGDGKSTFALPDMQGNVPIGQGQGAGLSDYFIGQMAGSQNVTLLQSEMPVHTHGYNASEENDNENNPGGNWFGAIETRYLPFSGAATTFMAPQAISIAGSSLPHNNMMSYLVVNFCIAMQGVFPPRG